MLRTVAVLVGAILGAGVGLLASFSDGIGLKVVIMSIGAVAGAAFGGGLSQVGKRKPPPPQDIPGVGFSAEEHATNYWRNKGEIYPMPGHPDPEGAKRRIP